MPETTDRAKQLGDQPAYPRGVIERDYVRDGEQRELRATSFGFATDGGLTLRQYFAGLAMQGSIAAETENWQQIPAVHADFAVKAADALLAALVVEDRK